MIVLVHGPDAALCRSAVADIVARHDPAGQSTSRIDGKTATLREIVAQAASPGFFGQGRVIVVDDLMARLVRGGKVADDPDAADATSAFDLAALFAAIAPDNLLVLVDPALAAIPAVVRKQQPPDVQIVAGDPPRGAGLLAWLQRRAEASDSSLDQPTARYLAERAYPLTWATRPNNPRFDLPPDLDRLAGEIEKLAVAAHPGPITRSLVERLVASGDQDQIFRFTDAVGRGARNEALVELQKLVAGGEEPFAVVAQLNQQAELATVLEAAGPGRDPTAIGRDLGLANPGRLAAIANSRRGRRSSGAVALGDALAVDRQIKRGELRDPLDPLYSLLARAGRDTTVETRSGGR